MKTDWLFTKPKHFFILLFILNFLLHLPCFFYTFLDVDESQFAGFAHTLMEGGLPYKDSVDTKPPLIYYFYKICFMLFGKYNMNGVHVMHMLISFLVAFGIYRIALTMKNSQAGMWGALFYIVFSTTYVPKFLATSITSIMIAPLVFSSLYWLKSLKEKEKLYSLLAGFLASVAFLFKYQAGIQIVIVFLHALFLVVLLKEKMPLLLRKYLFFLLGFIAPVFLMILWFKMTGVLSDYVHYSLQGSVNYIEGGKKTVFFFKNFLTKGGGFFLSTILLWILCGFFFIRVRKEKKPPEIIFVVLWFFLSFIPIATGGRFYGHYFIQLLPAATLLAGFVITTFSSVKAFNWVISLMVIPTVLFWTVRANYKSIDQLFPDDQLFQQQRIGEWIKNHTHQTDTLFVWGFATAIYFHAERSSMSRFLWTDLLTGRMPGSELSRTPHFDTTPFVRTEAWNDFWEDFKNPPTYFVDTSPANLHDYKKFPPSLYPDLWRYLNMNYQPFQSIEGVVIYKKK
ncbi:MAG: hypothetical protein A3G32_01055 [Deltaproteobacteria bacterium RIFCSPLOWO2_12_FULL_40_28]|nr:MAG: hypothetical protein A3C45_09940 [Deltaproteobacteria bacterium RIFCSPHIGHO2_02_FULL_40_28]OGQ19923.1 MAG: hypothetical protein A3E27_06890 [Deltaproteobacteria bacterium RIFCSPHIGHO2_12_FULL_40_32]OGQ39682.1 MAG: hypothetical protein A3I69_06320 [Deltaproteobacteria bacterium RIFCSPLOWO2_02_FULL_40_36]OGQ52938.1 MAG: hypothetical protein A3G32_01055 [Deltaproteobacteria bacterium RIFCSPLOWO2_12_FULL_40_28]